MKCIKFAIILLFSFSALVSTRPQSAQASGSEALPAAAATTAQPPNPLQVALLHWYRASAAASFAVGSQPYGVAFDGANIWSANFGDGTVSKIAANDGKVLGTYKIGFPRLG